MIKKVAIVGGTHGNEITGTYLLRRWAVNQSEISRDSFITTTLWANPKAFAEKKRFIDVDLNRSFRLATLGDDEVSTYEGRRATEINISLGPKQHPAVDFLIDIHTTTSNMGATLVLFEGGDEFDFNLAAFIKSKMPSVNLLVFNKPAEDLPYLVSIAPRRLALEIGPVPHGVMRHDVFVQANEVVRLALDYAHMVNKGATLNISHELETFVHKSDIGFPLDQDGNIFGMVHRDLQDRDYMELRKGDPLFCTLDGRVIRYEEDQPAYPVFVNEAAYYDSKIALSLTEKLIRKLKPV